MAKLVYSADILEFRKTGEAVYFVEEGVIITPSARDMAKEFGISFAAPPALVTKPAPVDAKLDDSDLQSIQEAREIVAKGSVAADLLASYSEEQIDRILRAMVEVAKQHEQSLAEMAVEETGFGNVTDKTFKNHLATSIVYEAIKDMKTIGLIEDDTAKRIKVIAEPVGLVLGIVPSTNPTSTAMFKSLIAIKSRNAIVLSPHPFAARCTLEAAKLMCKAAVEAGAPEDVVACASIPSKQSTKEMMQDPRVRLIIATGGAGLVRAANSSGKPTLGVGAGNTPAFIERSADVEKAARDIVASKTFDNGLICASEQAVVVEECIKSQALSEFRRQGAHLMSQEECRKVCSVIFRDNGSMNARLVGRSAEIIARAAGIFVPPGTKLLLGEQSGVGPDYPLSREKLMPVLAFYTVQDSAMASQLCGQLLQRGIGHTLCLHTRNEEVVQEFSTKPASRIIVNAGGTQGSTGASTHLTPSFTLGCGTWGGSSTSDNVSPLHLINRKRVAYGRSEEGQKEEQASTEADFSQVVEAVVAAIRGEGAGIPVGVSNRHIHLSQRDLALLFGPGYSLNKLRDLYQPGQYACKETVTICGPGGAIEKVRILGPLRAESQLEILAGDCRKLGVKPGEIITLVGPKGSLQLSKGAIIAQRHIHMSPADASHFNLKQGQLVSLEIPGPRGGLLHNTIIRIDENFCLECHLDIEESNATGSPSQVLINSYNTRGEQK